MADFNVEEKLKKLTMSEKVDLLSGIDFWHTKAIPHHGIPSIRLTDGPNGCRGTRFFNGVKAACFPCGTALGSTFNVELLEEAGRKMGDEAKLKGAHCILGPTINMQRSPLGGRGFESLAEDPLLSGLGAAALVRGIESTGIHATLKHFVCNDQEHRRNAVQSIVTDRALREIYALPFQLALRDATPGAIMTAYNGVNGTYCSESKKLLEDLLRGEWGFDGLVMSDWYGTYSTAEAALAGLDLEMPGPPRFRGELLKFGVSTDKVREHILDERARALLKFIKKAVEKSGVPESAPETTGNTPETAELLRRIGNESIVLLKNEGGLLPLKKDKKTVVIGPNAKIATYHGGGSASLAAYYAVTPFDGISSKLASPPGYALGAHSHKLLPLLGDQLKAPNGETGMVFRTYNEPPPTSGDGKAAAEDKREVLDDVVLTKSEIHLIDYYNSRLTSETFYAELEGSLVAEEDCTWELGVIVCGTAKLYVNGDLIVDNETEQRQGDAFFGTGTVEEKGRVQLKGGEKYTFLLRFGSAPTSKLLGSNVVFGGGSMRVGGCKVIDADAEIKRAAELAAEAEQVIICTGLNADWETEGADRADMDLPMRLNDLIVAVAAANPKGTVLVNQSGTPVTLPFLAQVPAVVQAWYGGNETGNALADVLFGDANPSAKLSLSWPVRGQDNPAYFNFRAEGGRTLYGEDIYIGYRYYELVDRPVHFPFGHGLSYTTFALSDLRVDTSSADAAGKLTATVEVRNTGSVAGAEVVQLYVAPPPRKTEGVLRPRKELRGFAKVHLAPGESKIVTVDAELKYAASFWDEHRSKWCVEDGEYQVVVSDSSAETEGKTLRGKFTVPETFWWSGL